MKYSVVKYLKMSTIMRISYNFLNISKNPDFEFRSGSFSVPVISKIQVIFITCQQVPYKIGETKTTFNCQGDFYFVFSLRNFIDYIQRLDDRVKEAVSTSEILLNSSTPILIPGK